MGSIDTETTLKNVANNRTTKTHFMKRVFNQLNSRLAVIALSGAVVLAGSAVAFSQKPKAEFPPPAVDERPIPRDVGGHMSFAPVVKKVAPGVVKVFTTTKVHNTSYNGNGAPG